MSLQSPVSLPPENYPLQQDYGTLTLQLRNQTRNVHEAFLHGQLEDAQRLSGDLFQTAYELLKLSSTLMIERNNRATITRNEESRTAAIRNEKQDNKTHQQRQQEWQAAVGERKIDGFYERHSSLIEPVNPDLPSDNKRLPKFEDRDHSRDYEK